MDNIPFDSEERLRGGNGPFRAVLRKWGIRREVWQENRDYLLSKCPPGTVAAAARQYDGDDRPLPSVLHYYAMGLHRANE